MFPATDVAIGDDCQFEAVGIKRAHWKTAAPIRSVFREAFKQVGLPYFNPHSFRNTLVQLGEQRCQTPEEFKAWSRNLGHEEVLTTFRSYGAVGSRRQGEIIRGLTGSTGPEDEVAEEIVRAVLNKLRGSRRPA